MNHQVKEKIREEIKECCKQIKTKTLASKKQMRPSKRGTKDSFSQHRLTPKLRKGNNLASHFKK